LPTPAFVQDQGYHKIFTTATADFEALAIETFHFQFVNNPVYKAFVLALKIDPRSVHSLPEIPFLPIRFFKSHRVTTTGFREQAVFQSSGTSGQTNSRHYVKDLQLYETSFTRCFEQFYGRVKDYCVIGLLPSYLERKNASLVYMTERLIQLSGHPQSGFYLDDNDKLGSILQMLEAAGQKTWLIGVSFALLDWANTKPVQLGNTILVETGGMKGRGKELVREELHSILQKAFGLPVIHSEYGMTELLSQAYSKGEGLFKCPPWMKIMIRDDEDPFQVSDKGNGIINIIDLANTWSCSFIATDDAGKLYPDGTFEVLGRVDGSDLRGCSLLLV
jgi:phenylacetate-coenzyme A ligase PaaK-like adenylate-forming protein